MRATAGQSSALIGETVSCARVEFSPAPTACGGPAHLLARLADLGSVVLGSVLGLWELLRAAAFRPDADRRLLLLRLDDRQAHLALLVLRRQIDHDGRAGDELLAQHEVSQRILDV